MNYNRLQIANKKAEKTYFNYHCRAEDAEMSDSDKKRLLGTYRKTKVFCSDPYCCGNPRRGKVNREALTRQELKSELNFTEQIIDMADVLMDEPYDLVHEIDSDLIKLADELVEGVQT